MESVYTVGPINGWAVVEGSFIAKVFTDKADAEEFMRVDRFGAYRLVEVSIRPSIRQRRWKG